MSSLSDAIFTTNTVGNIRVLNLQCGTELMHYNSGVIKSKCLYVMEGDYVLAAEEGPLIHAWPLNSSEKLQTPRMLCPGKVGCFSLSPDENFIAVSIDNKLLLWQLVSGKLLNTVSSHYQPINVIKWSRDSHDIVTGGEDGLVCVWKRSYLAWANCTFLGFESSNPQVTPRLIFSHHSIKITDLHVGHGPNARLFTASDDKTCKVYDMVSGNQLLSVVFDVRPTSVVADIPEANFYVGTADGSIKIVSLLDPPRSLVHHFEDNCHAVLVGHTKSVTCMALSTDESILVTGSKDETMRLWYVASKQCLRTIAMKAVVTNIVIRTPSKTFKSYDFLPKCVLRDFEKSYDQNKPVTVEYFRPDSLLAPSSSDSSDSEDELIELKEKVKKLSHANRELFNFLRNNILNTSKADFIVNTNDVKRNRAKRKRKIKAKS